MTPPYLKIVVPAFLVPMVHWQRYSDVTPRVTDDRLPVHEVGGNREGPVDGGQDQRPRGGRQEGRGSHMLQLGGLCRRKEEL